MDVARRAISGNRPIGHNFDGGGFFYESAEKDLAFEQICIIIKVAWN